VTSEEANHLVEGDRVKARDRTGTVVGYNELCIDPMGRSRDAGDLHVRRHAAHQQSGEEEMATEHREDDEPVRAEREMARPV
jgi:hypothetical protein